MGMGKKVKPKDLAVTLGIPTEDLLSHYKEDRDIHGLKRSYLEGVARRMAGAERRGSYVDVITSIMFGMVLFPNVCDFVNVDAINFFWVVKNLEVDTTPTLLADVCYIMNVYHNKEKESLRCCIPLLYQWFSSHLYKDIYMLETKGNHAWAQKLMSLNKRLILCGDTSYKELFRKVTRAWEKMHVKENKLKRKDTSSKESYTPLVNEMVHWIKLPFVVDPTYLPDIPDLIPVPIEDVDRLRATISRLEQDKESLEHSLYDTTY
ncbi:hypothetical protein KIW84_044766 [Lathyrus oleraceus]|uniref:DUF7745 domain-containing protein n=1 Tax=Pisum sativum TaxID=3888 RepID=A0A9D4XIJ8_PEA|nr:hypothetical protein KIW84_044766 [Pisum sativum]